MLNFSWNEEKDLKNFKKHQVRFHEAKTVWTDTQALEFFDLLHSVTEDRFLRLGYSKSGRLLAVVFAETEINLIRIISARTATDKERKDYEKGIRS